MKTKKIIAFVAAVSVASFMLAGCSSDNGAAEETTASVAEATVADESETAAEETEAAEETGASEEIAEEEPVEDEVSEDEGAADEIVVEGEVSANPLQPLADAAMSVGEWPMLMEVTDEMVLTDYYQFDISKYESSLVMQNPMSANMTEIIIFKSADVETAKADLEARRETAINMHAFYPDDVIRAEASIVGAEGEYAYFIMSDFAAEAETALIEAIKAL